MGPSYYGADQSTESTEKKPSSPYFISLCLSPPIENIHTSLPLSNLSPRERQSHPPTAPSSLFFPPPPMETIPPTPMENNAIVLSIYMPQICDVLAGCWIDSVGRRRSI